MNTNFFKQIAELNTEGIINLTIKKDTENIVISILLNNDACGDKAKHLIPPLTIKGTAEELDEQFFATITPPIESTSKLMVNMESYLKAQEEAQRQSAMEKEKAEKEKKAEVKRQKKYDELMEKVEELAKQDKPREAWTKLPSIEEYPEHADKIRKRRTELSAIFQPSLFSTE
ncbi:PRTRC system protein E [Ornithobacterium rhinotracheale]|uniref:PRTRC system protein E n=1 Tax=Ornithobacterium rhinotracheale TaxID=28251 RepID=A0A410JQ38_ORNRH|nr:PRTRC system protein E [Ornithobacterium rhinotracheale]QAR30283.1 PRTRC system protein E [Ornithobacterium rhinotracheale]